MDLQLKGKTVVLTGASKGIGRAALQLFAEEGATLIGSARGIDEMEAEAEALRGRGHDVTAFQCDVTKDEDVDKLIDFAKTKTGRIDIFVNNAAGKLPAGEFLGISNDDWLAGWNEKLQCYIRTCRAVFPVMQQQGGGRIVNVLGTAARNPRTSYMPVGVTNAALVNFNKSLADYGAKHNILVSAVAPSGVLTDRWHRLIRKRAEGEGKSPEQLQTEMDKTFPLGRMATPEELANMIVFVASPRASYHSGTVVIVDGASTSGVFN